MNVNTQLIMDANILTETNFLDWLKNLRLVLKKEILAYVIVKPLLESLAVDAPESVQRAYHKTVDAYSIVRHLREHYNEQVRTKGFKVSKQLFGSKMEKGTSLV